MVSLERSSDTVVSSFERMIEVTNENFNKVYPHLEHTLKNASFIAIDGEFTGIEEGDNVKNRLVCTLLGMALERCFNER